MVAFPQVLINVELGKSGAGEIMDTPQLKSAVADVEQALGQNGRVLLRPSGTEPLIRVMVEGRDAAQVTMLAEQLAQVVRAISR